MLVTINRQTITIQPNQTLREVLLANDYKQLQGIAVAINDVVIPKSNWDTTTLNENDQILVITATAGG